MSATYPSRRGLALQREIELASVMLVVAGALDVGFVAPDLSGRSILIAATAEIEASLIARRLVRWGAKVCTAADESVAGVRCVGTSAGSSRKISYARNRSGRSAARRGSS